MSSRALLRSLVISVVAIGISAALAYRHASAITYFEQDHDQFVVDWQTSTYDWQQVSNDLLPRPSSSVMVEINPGSAAVSGVVISPNWIISARHNSDGGNWLGSTKFYVDTNGDGAYGTGERYKAVQVEPDAVLDLVLVRLEKYQQAGVPAGLTEFVQPSTLSGPLHVGSSVTLAGFGKTQTEFNAAGAPIGNGYLRGELKFGRNVVETNGTISFTAPSTSGYVPYEAQGMVGDSGGGWFIRDGWDWRLAKVFRTPIDASDVGSRLDEWIVPTVGSDLPSYAPTSVPLADTEWQGVTTLGWSTPNWTQGVPTATDNAW
jgi:hypothetical protein